MQPVCAVPANTSSLQILSFRLLPRQAICFCVMSKTLSVGVTPPTLGPLCPVFSTVIMREWSREKRKMKLMHRLRSVDACTIFASFHSILLGYESVQVLARGSRASIS
ncbi:uncharacterized protein LOC144567308 [Carex rostrata]